MSAHESDAPIIGVKAYGWEWANDHGMTMAQAADRLVAQGVDWVLAQNLIDPLPGSAVDQSPPVGQYSDVEWTQTLKDRGLRVFQTTATFFDPEEFTANPHLRPIDQYGHEAEEFGWYRGINPTDEDYLERKLEKILRVVEETQPDGLFISFFRFPGFWELWLPDASGFEGTRRGDIREYGFDDQSVGLFTEQTGISPEGRTTAERAQDILRHHRHAWTTWKCQWIARVAKRLRAAVHEIQPGTELMLNGFGLGDDDFDNVVEEVLGQDLTMLDEAFDYHELMFYFQIQKRDPLTWIPKRVAEARAKSSRPIFADLQGGAEYLESIYDIGQRERELSDEGWLRALHGVADSGADGLLVYSWRDLLESQASGGTKVESLLRYKSGDLPPLS